MSHRRGGTLESRYLALRLRQSPTTEIEVRLLPSGIHSLLRLGIRRQLEIKYRPYFGDECDLLGAAVVKSVLGEAACDQELARYVEENATLIEQQARHIHHDYPLAHAFSILLSFTLVLLGTKYPEKSIALTERVIELELLLRSTNEIVPTDDAIQFLEGVQRIAQYLVTEELGPSH